VQQAELLTVPCKSLLKKAGNRLFQHMAIRCPMASHHRSGGDFCLPIPREQLASQLPANASEPSSTSPTHLLASCPGAVAMSSMPSSLKVYMHSSKDGVEAVLHPPDHLLTFDTDVSAANDVGQRCSSPLAQLLHSSSLCCRRHPNTAAAIPEKAHLSGATSKEADYPDKSDHTEQVQECKGQGISTFGAAYVHQAKSHCICSVNVHGTPCVLICAAVRWHHHEQESTAIRQSGKLVVESAETRSALASRTKQGAQGLNGRPGNFSDIFDRTRLASACNNPQPVEDLAALTSSPTKCPNSGGSPLQQPATKVRAVLQSPPDGAPTGLQSEGASEMEHLPSLTALQLWLLPLSKEPCQQMHWNERIVHTTQVVAGDCASKGSTEEHFAEQTERGTKHPIVGDSVFLGYNHVGQAESFSEGKVQAKQNLGALRNGDGNPVKNQRFETEGASSAPDLSIVQPCCALLDSLEQLGDSSDVVSLQMAPAGEGMRVGC
jgi:hypothetical protein